MWHERSNTLIREFRFKDFNEAFTFMTCIALLAERMNHHPTIYNSYSFVRLELTTHDAGNEITEKDRNFARAVDRILG
jgi:4a-hydroxytetrahydrobiopterin dehydratase